MVVIPLNLVSLPLFVTVLLLDAWLLATFVWLILLRRVPAYRYDQVLRWFVESPVTLIGKLIERNLRLGIPSVICWGFVVVAAVVIRQLLVAIITPA